MKLATCLLALCAACAPSAKVTARELAVPPHFERAATGASAATVDWRAFFADDALVALIGEALAHNLDLQIALARIELARASVRGATGTLLPQVSAFAGGSLTRYGRHTLDGAGAPPNPVAELAFGLQASWEPDLWGKLRSLRGSARAQYLASIEGTNLVITNLVAEVAVGYFELLALDQQRDILRETITRQTKALEMIRVQKAAGRVNELAVQQFEAQVASTQAQDAATAQQTHELENRLAVLLGRMPGPIPRAKEGLQREVATTLATGVPSELLRNRPDIREAELRVEASKFDVAAARAAFYPSISITANAGYGAFEPRYLLRTPDSIIASIASSLVAPLVNRRGLEAELSAAKAMQLAAIYQYQSVVLGSFAEVATGLSTLERAAQIVSHRRHKQAAVAGTVDAVIDQNPRVEARDAVDWLIHAAQRRPPPALPPIRIQAVFKENIPQV